MSWYRVPVYWQVTSEVVVKADNEDEATEMAMGCPLPPREDWEYVEGSFRVEDADLRPIVKLQD
jgi:hypothetical protein